MSQMYAYIKETQNGMVKKTKRSHRLPGIIWITTYRMTKPRG